MAVYGPVISPLQNNAPGTGTGFEQARTVVVKLGSAVLTQTGSSALDLEVMRAICAQVAEQVKAGRQIIMVTSGAVAAGRGVLDVWDRKPTIAVKQALAAVGQSRLMQIYTEMFEQHGIVVGQILLSLRDMESRKRYVNARYTLEELLRRGCVPIINENDTVTVDQLKFGDNDGLAAMVAVKMQADALLLLSDVAGLYDSNPKTNPAAVIIPVVERVTADVMKTVGEGSGGGKVQIGTGGMETKLHAARLATANGVGTVIGPGKDAGVISKALTGANVGTYFPPGECHRTRRKMWIVSGKSHGRRVVVDDGARDALRLKKKSLLPAGITAVEGNFQALDLVEIADQAGQVIGRGVINYNSLQLCQIMGKRSSDIEKILGAKGYDEAIHRDNLVVEG